MTLAMGVYASLFVIAYISGFCALSRRRFLSFAIFMTIFAYVFIKIDAVMAEAFKMAIVASTAFLQSIIGRSWPDLTSASERKTWLVRSVMASSI